LSDGGSSIRAVQALLRALAAGRDVAEIGTAFGEGAAAMAETARRVVTVERDPARAAAEILTTPTTAADRRDQNLTAASSPSTSESGVSADPSRL